MNALMRGTALAVGLLGSLLVAARTSPASALTDDAPADVVYRTTDLRIYRSLDRHGAVALVLTNLDEEGNQMRGTSDTIACGPASTQTAAPGGGAPAIAGTDRTTDGNADATSPSTGHGGVTVTVNGGAGTGPADGTQIDVHDGGEGGTTVVININNNPPPPQPPPVAVYPAFVVGGIAGPFHYPDRQPFLGYSNDGTSPGFFGGLGLNAGNRFGLKTGNGCGNGYDCLFAPTARRP